MSCGVSTRSHPESSKPAAAAGGLRGSGGEGPGGGGVARENPTQIELFVKTRLSFGAPSQHRGREDELAGTFAAHCHTQQRGWNASWKRQHAAAHSSALLAEASVPRPVYCLPLTLAVKTSEVLAQFGGAGGGGGGWAGSPRWNRQP